jgi:predicted MPP superfamily phosphohydrolase
MELYMRVFSDVHYEHTQYLSDMWEPPHLDTDNNTILILAGDLCTGKLSLDVIQLYSNRFKQVLIVLGNHDYYLQNIHTFAEEYAQACNERFANVTLLHSTTFEIGDYVFVGDTFWTNMKEGDAKVIRDAHLVMQPDFAYILKDVIFDEETFTQRITKITSDVWLNAHHRQFDYINHVVQNSKDKKVIVVTHHAPSLKSVAEKYKRYGDSNYYFGSDCDDFMHYNPQIKYWIHGHMHNKSDYLIGNTRVLANPKGYPNEYNEFDELSLYKL